MEISMKTNCSVVTNGTTIKKVIILTKLLILFLVIFSSMAMAYIGSSDENRSNDIHRNVVTKTGSSSQFSFSPINPEFSSYVNNTTQQKKYHLHHRGRRPSPIDLSYLKNTKKASLNSLASSPSYGDGDVLPSSYDLRTLNRVTPVKDQGCAYSCWAFATDASLESSFMPAESWDFSENNMKNMLSSDNGPQGFDRSSNDVGSSFISAAYLTRWSGPVNTADDPYDCSSNLSYSEFGLPIRKHVQNVTWIPPRSGPMDNDAIKEAIMTYAGVMSGMLVDNASPQNWTNTFNPSTESYYVGYTPDFWNHYVTLVGWDDSYRANNFSTNPPGDGAFIAKNSWCMDGTDNGYYIYISYYDGALGYVDNAYFTGEPPNNYAHIYQYDPLGWDQSIGSSSTTCWAANIFTANSNEILNAVSFYTTDLNCNYVINIYTNTGSQPSNQDGPVLTQSGTISNVGYHTVPLNSGIQLFPGQTFSVVLELTNPNYIYPIAVETPLSGHLRDYSSQATANFGESFVSTDGNTWTDITTKVAPNTVACIKAFTNNSQATPIITWSNPDDIAYGTALDSTQLNAYASDPSTGYPVSGTFSYNPVAGTLLGSGIHTLNTIFTPTDTAKYTQASATALINVNKAIPTIIWSNPADILYGTALNSTQLGATSSVPGTYIYSPFLGTILGEGPQTLNVLFIPTDYTDYNIAATNVSINVS